MSKQILKDGRIQYRDAWIEGDTGRMYAYGTPGGFTAPSRTVEVLLYYDCVEKRPDLDGYYESHWVYNVEETA
jgi:hypothetical protein